MPLFWSTARQMFRQPAMLFLLVIQCAVITVLLVGLHIERTEGKQATIRFYSLEFKVDSIVRTEILPPVIATFISINVILFVVGLSHCHAEYLADSTTGVLLTRIRSRTAFFLVRLFGVQAALTADIVLFFICTALAVGLKGGSPPLLPILLAGAILSIELLAFNVMSSTFGLLTGSASASTLLLLAVIVLLGPLTGSLSLSAHPIMSTTRLIIPPTGLLQSGTMQAIVGHPAPLLPCLHAAVPTAVYFLISLFLFEHRDV